MTALKKYGLPFFLLLTALLAAHAQSNASPAQQTPRVMQAPTIEYADDQFAVLAWSTDVPSDSRIFYGTEANNLTQVAEGASNTTVHRVHLSNLTAGTKYYFQIETAQNGTPGAATASFETPTAGAPPLRNQRVTEVAVKPAAGPVITDGPVIQYADDRSAVITWTTDKPAPNVVYYGVTRQSLTQTAEGEVASTSHRVHLSNLQPGTAYYFQVDTGQSTGASMPIFQLQTAAAGGAPVYDRTASTGTGMAATTSEPQAAESSNGGPELQRRREEKIYKGGQLVPAGTEMQATLDTQLSSKTSRVGDEFTATVNQPINGQNGKVAIPAGSRIRGQVSDIEQGRVLATVRGKARMDLKFTDVILPNGTTLPITATLLGVGQRANASSNTEGGVTDKTQGKEVAKDVGIGAGLGTVAGLIFGSALKGLAIGALAGGGYVLATQGRDVQLPSGSPMSIRLDHQLSLPPVTNLQQSAPLRQ